MLESATLDRDAPALQAMGSLEVWAVSGHWTLQKVVGRFTTMEQHIAAAAATCATAAGVSPGYSGSEST